MPNKEVEEAKKKSEGVVLAMSTPCSLEIHTGKEREANQVEASIRIPDVFGSF